MLLTHAAKYFNLTAANGGGRRARPRRTEADRTCSPVSLPLSLASCVLQRFGHKLSHICPFRHLLLTLVFRELPPLTWWIFDIFDILDAALFYAPLCLEDKKF